jgi:hypothetical protein
VQEFVLVGRHLFVVSAVHVSHFSQQFWMNKAIGADEMVRQSRLPMVNMRQYAYVPCSQLQETASSLRVHAKMESNREASQIG